MRDSALSAIAPEVGGLAPGAWLCVRDGYSREEVKDELLRLLAGGAITGPAVCSLEGLAAAVLGVRADRILRPDARREVLRTLLRSRAIAERMPEIQRKSQGGRRARFVARLDLAIAGGRLCFAHHDEWVVQEERLRQARGARALRTEISTLALAYETWLESEDYWDLPRLLAAAAERLRLGEAGALPARVHRLGISRPEPREAQFWEALAAVVEVRDVAVGPPPSEPEQTHEIWHSVDDAAHAAAEGWAAEPASRILIPDSAEVRRSLRFALGGKLRDPRDPMGLATSEKIKLGLLPLRVVAFGFTSADCRAYLARAARVGLIDPRELEAWAFEMSDAGWVGGLAGARREKFPRSHALLAELEREYGARRTAEQLARAHLLELERLALPAAPFDRYWPRLSENLALVGGAGRRLRAREAMERLSLLIEESPAESDGFYDRGGAQVYRAQVARPLGADPAPITILGLGADWLDQGAGGDLWYSEADREALREFGLLGRDEVREMRLASLRSWIAGATRVRWVDYCYEMSGAERERADRLWRELGQLEARAEYRGAHPRWAPSFAGPALPSQREIRLPFRGTGGRPLLTATQLENASICGAVSLVRDRWRLRDLEEVGPEIQPSARGQLLHDAVRRLIQSRGADGTVGLTASEALDQALEKIRLRGLMRGGRVRRVARARLLPILDAFLAEESAYFARSGARPIALEEKEIVYRAAQADLKGRPDRIDESQSGGLFVMDYKSSSSSPSGTEMLEHGYRLQLPLYALGAEQALGKPALGVQFIPLSREGKRRAGVFFNDTNGKEPGKLTQTTKANKSLLQLERAEVWRAFAAHIDAAVARMLAGEYSARPRRGEKECATCRYLDLCGQHRDAVIGGSGDEEGETA